MRTAFVFFLLAASCQAQVLLQDDFNGTSIDASKWIASPPVVEQNGRIELTGGSLTTRDSFSSFGSGGIDITGEWTLNAPGYPYHDQLSVLTRSDGGISDGLEFMLHQGQGGIFIYDKNSGFETTLASSTFLMNQGDHFSFDIRDTGSSASFSVTKLNGTGGSVSISTPTSQVASGNQISFYNRGGYAGTNFTAYLDNVAIRRDSTQTHVASEILNGSVTWDVSGGHARGVFTPGMQLSLHDAAAALGFDHFNWIQTITGLSERDLLRPEFQDPSGRPPSQYITGKLVPFFDPVAGGYRYMGSTLGHPTQDNLPFYFDEEFSTTDKTANISLATNDSDAPKSFPFQDDPNFTWPGHSLWFSDSPTTFDEADFTTVLDHAQCCQGELWVLSRLSRL